MTEETFNEILHHLEDQKHPSNAEPTDKEKEILLGFHFFNQMTKELRAAREAREALEKNNNL